MVKRLLLVRHAHRDTADRGLDNGLSRKGARQARRLLSYWRRAFAEERPLVLTSPKKRCVETVAGIGQAAGARLVMDKRLLDLAEREAGRARPRRLLDFLTWWKEQAPALTLACSHGDWIETFLKLSVGTRGGLKKGGLAEIRWDGKQAELAWLIQSFKNLL